MNTQMPTNPFEWANNATSYARTMLAEWEKQAERWTEYGASQATEAARIVRALQTQAFDAGKNIIETAEKAFHKAG